MNTSTATEQPRQKVNFSVAKHINILFDQNGKLTSSGSNNAFESLTSGKIEKIWIHVLTGNKDGQKDDCLGTIDFQLDSSYKLTWSDKVKNRFNLPLKVIEMIRATSEEFADVNKASHALRLKHNR